MDIKMPDLKAVFEKLSGIKNYMNLMVPLIIAVVAGLMFIPTALLSGGLKDKINTESVRRGADLDRMAKSPISKNQYLEERKSLQAYSADANRVEQMAKESTERDLLSYKLFPKPTDASVLIFEEFGKRFRAGVEQQIAKLRGHDCPTDLELAEHLRAVQGQGQGMAGDPRGMGMGMYTPYGPPGAGRTAGRAGSRAGGAGGNPMDYGMGSMVADQIVEAVCTERAQNSGLYVNPANVAGYEFWAKYQYDVGTEQAVKDCWYWQLGYWMVEDVFDTIRASNAGARNVLDAPVKRLMRVGFNRSMMGMGQALYAGGATQDSTQGEAMPRYVLSAYDGLTLPCTGRLSKGGINVVHFDVTVVVRADSVMDFMKQLCGAKEHAFSGADGQQPPKTFKHNQITILESTLRTVERGNSSMPGSSPYQYYGGGAGMAGAGGMGGTAGMPGMMGMEGASHQLYRYGQDAVVELDLVCEYVFEKAGYEALIPDTVKKIIETSAPANP